MKNTINTLVSFLAMSSFAMASADAIKPATDAVKPAINSPKPAAMTVKIVSIDNAAKTITVSEMVKGTDGKEMAKETKMTWNEQTKLMWSGADAKVPAATLTDLKVGESINITVSATNPTLANEIHIVKLVPATTTK